MNIVNELSKNKYIIILFSEVKHQKSILDILKKIEKRYAQICYLCLNKPYTDILEDLKKNGNDVKKFSFIDVLSSHYIEQKNIINCTFVKSPDDLNGIKNAINCSVNGKKSKFMVFDTVSALLGHNQQEKILHFINNLLMDLHNINQLFLFSKEESILYDENLIFVDDLRLFVNKIFDLNHNIK